MEKITLLFLLFTTMASGQQDAANHFELNPVWKFELSRPLPFGDNSLAKAYSNNFGFGVELDLFKYDRFRLGGGFNFVRYKVAEKSLIGNFEYANYSSEYVAVSYEYPVTEAISITPELGYGYAKLHQKSASRSFGWQDGNELRLGATGNCYFSEYSSVYLAIRFIHTSLDITTNREFADFYSKMNQLQFAVGLQFD
ncbi:MAG TPA: hypothetical protein VF676_10780 [Flavobacterium sp.]|jgi:hypothetical protein